MADIYTVAINQETAEEITGGRVGHFLLKFVDGGDYFIGGSGVDDTTGIQIANLYSLYVTSPDEVYLYNQAPSTTGHVRIFHNR